MRKILILLVFAGLTGILFTQNNFGNETTGGFARCEPCGDSFFCEVYVETGSINEYEFIWTNPGGGLSVPSNSTPIAHIGCGSSGFHAVRVFVTRNSVPQFLEDLVLDCP